MPLVGDPVTVLLAICLVLGVLIGLSQATAG